MYLTPLIPPGKTTEPFGSPRRHAILCELLDPPVHRGYLAAQSWMNRLSDGAPVQAPGWVDQAVFGPLGTGVGSKNMQGGQCG